MHTLITGSRAWQNTARVDTVIARLAPSTTAWSIGDATGVDGLALQAIIAGGQGAAASVFCVGDPASGAGCWRQTDRAAVQLAQHAGATVMHWAGGDATVDLYARLARRSEAMVRAAIPAEARILAFAQGQPKKAIQPALRWQSCGSGTWATLALAVGLGIRALIITHAPNDLPPWTGGTWQVGTFAGGRAACWQPDA